jgi:hypothetical protein
MRRQPRLRRCPVGARHRLPVDGNQPHAVKRLEVGLSVRGAVPRSARLTAENPKLQRIRQRLQALLGSSDRYDVALLLARVGATELWEERVILHRKVQAAAGHSVLPGGRRRRCTSAGHRSRPHIPLGAMVSGVGGGGDSPRLPRPSPILGASVRCTSLPPTWVLFEATTRPCTPLARPAQLCCSIP